jgi:hypothetical protein
MFLSWDEDPILCSYMAMKKTMAYAWHISSFTGMSGICLECIAISLKTAKEMI